MRRLLLLLGLFPFLWACKNEPVVEQVRVSPELTRQTEIADSMLSTMSVEEKVGQLLLFKSELSSVEQLDSMYSWIEAGKLGGLLLHHIPVDSFRLLVRNSQLRSAHPLFIATEEQFTLHNQFSDTPRFPNTASLISLDSDSIREELAKHFIDQCKSLGVNLSISLDAKPAEQFLYWLDQLESEHILALGDFMPIEEILLEATDADRKNIQYFTDLLRHSSSALKNVLSKQNTAISYKQNFDSYTLGLTNIQVSAVENVNDIPQLLQENYDLFLVGDNAMAVYNFLLEEVRQGMFTQQMLNKRVRKVLLAKAWLQQENLFKIDPLSDLALTDLPLQASLAIPETGKVSIAESPVSDYFTQRDWQFLSRKLTEESLVLAQNYKNLLPFSYTYNRNFQIVSYGTEPLKTFTEYFKKYADYKTTSYKVDKSGVLPIFNIKPTSSTTVVLTLNSVELQSQKHQEFISTVNNLSKQTSVVVVNFGNLLNLSPFDSTITLVQVFERTNDTEAFAVQLLFGSIQAKGNLPFDVSSHLRKGQGIKTNQIRMKYTVPEEVGIAPERLVGIDAIAKSAIDHYAFPGCQVLVAKNGNIIYDKAFGRHSYKKDDLPVELSDLYDVASITKVAATTLAAMKLYDEDKLELNKRVNDYLSKSSTGTIGNIKVQNLFTHYSGLQPQMPIYNYLRLATNTNVLCDSFFCTTYKEPYTIPVAEGLFIRNDQPDAVWNAVTQLQPSTSGRYRYSDVNFNIIQRLVEQQAEMPMDEFLMSRFYQPLGLRRSLFNPLERIPANEIAPTANDKWRKQTLQGYVHDEAAALLGGVAGNAGLFSNAEELAVLFQMMLNKGVYGGKRYLYPETIERFTSTSPGTTRGLGFDKPEPGSGSDAYAKDAPASSFGHTGFTGTCVWADPDNDLIFVFLSNRIHPDVKNKVIYQREVRSRMHQVIYDALNTYEAKTPVLDQANRGARGRS